MTTSMRRFGSAIFITCVACSCSRAVLAQEKTPFPALSDKRVYVEGVAAKPFQSLEEQINQLERSSPQTYYAVVVKYAGPGEKAAIRYAEDLFARWRTPDQKSGRSIDPDRSVLIVLAVDNNQVAVHPGALLRSRFGLSTTVARDLIQRVFIEQYAEYGKYPEGLAALLNEI